MGAGFVILGAICAVVLIGLLALILGIVALVRISRSGGALRGRGLAVAAIVIGGLMLLTPVLGSPVLYLFLRCNAPTSVAPRPVPAPPSTVPPVAPEE